MLHEATRTGGFAGEVAAVVMEEAFESLKAPAGMPPAPAMASRCFSPMAAMVIPGQYPLIASTVVFLRVALEIGIISPGLLPRMLPQLAAMTALMAVACAAYYVIFITRLRSDAMIMAAAPSNLRAAVVFGLLYAKARKGAWNALYVFIFISEIGIAIERL